eukprot:3476520-Pleurochrysis_carterae.AAC.1
MPCALRAAPCALRAVALDAVALDAVALDTMALDAVLLCFRRAHLNSSSELALMREYVSENMATSRLTRMTDEMPTYIHLREKRR